MPTILANILLTVIVCIVAFNIYVYTMLAYYKVRLWMLVNYLVLCDYTGDSYETV